MAASNQNPDAALRELETALEAVDWRDVDGIGVVTASTFAKRVRAARVGESHE